MVLTAGRRLLRSAPGPRAARGLSCPTDGTSRWQRTGVAIGIAQIKSKFGQLRIHVDVAEVSAGPLQVVSDTAASMHLRSAAVPGSVREQVYAIADSAARHAEGYCIHCGAPALLQQGFNRICATHGQGGTP